MNLTTILYIVCLAIAVMFIYIFIIDEASGTVLYIDKGLNRQFINDNVDAINQSYFIGIRHIWFSNESNSDNIAGQYNYHMKRNNVYAYNSHIIMYVDALYDQYTMRIVLLHELGHHDCIKRFDFSESCADAFADSKMNELVNSRRETI